MADEKKLTNEITDEQANEASGGGAYKSYKCECGCGRTYWGAVPYYVNGKPCCLNCYANIQQQEDRPYRRP